MSMSEIMCEIEGLRSAIVNLEMVKIDVNQSVFNLGLG